MVGKETVNLVLTCCFIVYIPCTDMFSSNSVAGIEAIIEQFYEHVFHGNNIPSGYISGIDDPDEVSQILSKKNWC